MFFLPHEIWVCSNSRRVVLHQTMQHVQLVVLYYHQTFITEIMDILNEYLYFALASLCLFFALFFFVPYFISG